jgi:UbiD family decarboxylase
MAFSDLSEFITLLEKRGHLKRIKTRVSPELEITEITDRVSKGPLDRNVALLFENVAGSDFPVLINSLGHPERMAWALGVDDLEELNQRLATLIDLKLPQGFGPALARANDLLSALRAVGLRPNIVKKAPAQERVYTGDDVNLEKLPILKCWPGDGGRFVTLPTVISRDPKSNTRNVGMYRLQMYDRHTLGMHWQIHKGGAEHTRVAQETGVEGIPVAVSLGGDPAVMWCGSAPLPPGIDEFLLAGWLRGKPVELVRCITQPIEAPADAEFVIEGYVDPDERAPEGPFGDHTGYYTPVDEYPVLHVTAITHRRRPIYPTTIVGIPPMEDYWMGKATERLFLPLYGRDRGRQHAGRGRLSQPGAGQHQEALPRPRAQDYQRPVGAGSHDAGQVHYRLRRRRGRAEHKPGYVPRLEQRGLGARRDHPEGADRCAGPRQLPLRLWRQNWDRRHPQAAHGGLYPRVAGSHPHEPRGGSPGGRHVEEARPMRDWRLEIRDWSVCRLADSLLH